jgi:two-component system, OmpR family, sensor histidine kinase SenX3
VDVTTAAILGAIGGIVLSWLAVYAVRLSERQQRRVPTATDMETDALPRGVGDVLAVLRSSAIVLDGSDAVVNNSPAAVADGLVRHSELVSPELLEMARQVRRDGVIREAELQLPSGSGGRSERVFAARVAPLGGSHVLLLVEDRSQERRLEEIRRDFVANVSHELKTPVGGLALLAEAVLDAHDDPEAIVRFAQRMQVESNRLTRLVQEIVDFSRLQAAASFGDSRGVDVSAAAREAVDQMRIAADSKGIELSFSASPGCAVWGDHDLLVTAVRNLVGNAVAYSEPHTRVAVDVRAGTGDIVQVTVTDQGRGIPASEQERIFERFYRIDAARSRATGGTGLGLSIVKHVVAHHGGTIGVWSEPGQGSTFTVRIPAAASGTRSPAGEFRHTEGASEEHFDRLRDGARERITAEPSRT